VSALENPEPYKGPLSYGSEDWPLFFGRDNDVDRVRACVLENRLSVLHAPSGAGKTSLLSTNIVPNLIDESFVVAMCRPDPEPEVAAQEALLNALFPSPKLEAQAVEAIGEILMPEDWPDTPMIALGDHFRDIRPYQPQFRQLMRRGEGGFGASVIVQSLYLHSGWTHLRDYMMRLAGMAVKKGHSVPDHFRDPGRDTTIAQYRAFVTDPAICETLERTRAMFQLERGIDAEKMNRFVHRMLVQLPDLLRPVRLVLVIDQFEQFFTLFDDTKRRGDRAQADMGGSYKIRDRFFKDIGAMLTGEVGGKQLPVRVLVSLRDDYIASLDMLGRFCGGIERGQMHHVDLLPPTALDSVIRKPARIFGYDYDDETFEEIRESLTIEERFVEPAQVQIVCSRLWRDHGKALFNQRRAAHEDGANLATFRDGEREAFSIGPDALSTAGGVEGILDSYFRDFIRYESGSTASPRENLERRERPVEDQVAIIDLLSHLSTPQGTRNIASLDTLLERRFLDAALTERLLEELVKASIIRVDPHRSGKIVEVTHEFLLDLILEEGMHLRSEHPLWDRFLQALRKLEAINTQFRPNNVVLDPVERDAMMRFSGVLDETVLRESLARFLLGEIVIGEKAGGQSPERFETFVRHWSDYLDPSDAPLQVDVDLEARVRGETLTERDLASIGAREPGQTALPPFVIAALTEAAVGNLSPHSARKVLRALESHVAK